MENSIPRILRAFEGQVWAVDPDKLRVIAAVLATKASTGQVPEAADIEAAAMKQRGAAVTAGATAVLPLFGTISYRMSMLDAMSGGSSLESFADSFREALADDEISRVMVRFDSPGGSVSGVEEAAALIAGSSKPVIGLIDPQAGSAAYWLAAQCDDLVVTPSGQAGSIGCYTVHFDYSEHLADEGINVTVIKAGSHKAEGNPYESLSDEAAEHIQSLVDVYDEKFTAAVAAGRGVDVQTVRESFGQGRMFDAERLVKLGMADRIATYDDLLEELRADAARSRSMARSSVRMAAADVGDEIRLDAWIAAASEGAAPVTDLVTEAVRLLTQEIKTDVAGGHAAMATTPAPISPASEAKGDTTMSDLDKAAQSGAANQKAEEDGRAAERTRVLAITALGREHKIEQAAIDKMIEGNTTVEEAKDAILAEIKGKATASPTVSSSRVHLRADDDPKRGFRSPRDFLVAAMSNNGHRSRADVSDERLRPLAVSDSNDRESGGEVAFMLPSAFTPSSISAAAGSDEQGGYADTYGGFAVPGSMAPGMLQVGAESDPTAGRTQSVPMSTPSVDFLARVDKNHSSSVSGGLTVSRKPETSAATSSRMQMEKVSLKATSLFGLAYATEEILTDSPISFAAIIASGFGDQFQHHMIGEKIRGLGNTEYLGVLNSDCLVSISEETSQAGDTIQAENVINMRSRCWGYGNAIWIANHDAYPQLATMAVSIGSAGVVQIYSPSLREDRPDMLLGRPIFYSEYASTLGDPGDIILGNWSQYLDGLYQPLQSDESVHVRFVNHERTFKFWLRNAGAPWWRSALTPNQSSTTLSPFVVIEDRD